MTDEGYIKMHTAPIIDPARVKASDEPLPENNIGVLVIKTPEGLMRTKPMSIESIGTVVESLQPEQD